MLEEGVDTPVLREREDAFLKYFGTSPQVKPSMCAATFRADIRPKCAANRDVADDHVWLDNHATAAF